MKKKIMIIIFGLSIAINIFGAISVTSPSGGETLQSPGDYASASFQDPWDMDVRTDLGWFIFDVVSGSKSNLANITFTNGIFSATSTSSDPNISILDTGFGTASLTADLGKIGTNYPIDANKYKVIAFRMNLNVNHDALFYWSRNTIYSGMSRSGIFGVSSGWKIYIINIPNLGAYPVTGSTITWSGNIDSLRFDPAPVPVNVSIDWIRLVENTGSLYRTVTWTGNSGAVDIYLDNDRTESNGTLGVVAKSVSGSSYSLYAGALFPGTTYYVGIKNSSGGSLSYSNGYYRVNDIPTLVFTSPSEEGGADFATVELGNPWDMDATSDLDGYAYLSGAPVITTVSAENLRGENLGNVRVLKGTSKAVSGSVGEPVLYPLWFDGGRGATTKIDSSKYRVLVLKMSLPGNWDPAHGSEARVFWHVQGEFDNNNIELMNQSADIIINHKSGKIVMNSIIADLKTLKLEASQSKTGWNGLIDGFRVDPHEFPQAKDFYIQDIKIAAFERADTSYTFRWNYTDSIGESPSLNLYYDTNASGYDGTLIQSGINPASGQYTWNTSNKPAGTYYIYATYSDGTNSNRTYARWPIVIDHNVTTSPTISLDKSSLTFEVGAGNTQAFTVSNSGTGTLNWTVSDDQAWMSVKPTSGQNSGTVTVTVNRTGLSGGTYTGTITVTDPNATNSPQTIDVTLNVSGGSGSAKIKLSRSKLYYGASGSKITTPQTFLISNSGTGTLSWTVSENKSWLGVSPASGTNTGLVTVTANKTGISAGTYTGNITVSSTNASNSPQTIAVILKVYDSTNNPFGDFSTPEHNSTVRSSIPVTGWVVDDIDVSSVKIYNGDSYVGDAVFIEGARPDVEQAYPGYPRNYLAGWGYMMLTYFLPGGGNGYYTFYAKATDAEGHVVTLGSKTVYIDNAHAVKPFGAIDTPGQGGVASGSNYTNAGWVLTPLPNKVPTNGSTIEVYIDGVKKGTVTYNIYRSDIATLFPGYQNSNAAGATFKFNTTSYTSGIHSIHWIAKDNAGNADGVGSRYFTIQNTGSSSQAETTAMDLQEQYPIFIDELSPIPVDTFAPVRVTRDSSQQPGDMEAYPDDKGIIHVETRELERLEISLEGTPGVPGDTPSPLAPVSYYTGWLVVGDQLKPLPIGSFLDSRRGIFYWGPGPGFVGNYELVFIDRLKNRLRRVNITILPKY